MELTSWSFHPSGESRLRPIRFKAPRELRRLQGANGDGTEKVALVCRRDKDALVVSNWRYLVIGDEQGVHLLDFHPDKGGEVVPYFETVPASPRSRNLRGKAVVVDGMKIAL